MDRKNDNKIVHGSSIHITKAKFAVLKGWLLNPRMRKSHLLENRPKTLTHVGKWHFYFV